MPSSSKTSEPVSLADLGDALSGFFATQRATRGNPALVALAKSLGGEGRTLLSALLAERAYVTVTGRPFAAAQVKRLIEA
jgi:hypothetical protein